MEKVKYHTAGPVPKSNRKVVETEAKWISLTQYTWPLTFLTWYRQILPVKVEDAFSSLSTTCMAIIIRG
jgi:hypothetical protein